MKYFSVVFALSTFNIWLSLSPAFAADAKGRHNAQATPTPVASTSSIARPDASLPKYNLWMATGRALKTELAKNYSQSKSLEAVEAFRNAVLYAPTLPQRAEAWVEGGEVLHDMAAYPQALNAFQSANKLELSSDFKRRALFGIAQIEFQKSKYIDFAKSGTLKNDALKLRANYDAALKAGTFTEKQMRDMWSDIAEISVVEGKHLEAARHYTKLLETTPAKKTFNSYGNSAIEQLQKTANLSPKEQSEAADLTNRIYAIYLPLRKDLAGNAQGLFNLDRRRIEYSNLLAQFGQATRAEKLRAEIAASADVELNVKTDALALIAQAQTVQKKYDAALLTLDRVEQLVPSLAARRHFERAKVFSAQEKWDAAALEYAKVPAISTVHADQKVEAFWGIADLAALRVEALRRKNAPSAEIATHVAEQGSRLRMAAFQTDAKYDLKRQAMLKVAAWERAQGNEIEAKKWEERAKSLVFRAGGK